MSTESYLLLSQFSESGEFASNKSKGSGYHKQYDNLHTFTITLTNFQGEVRIQGTLSLYPNDDSDWFSLKDLENNSIIFGDGSSVDQSTTTHSVNSRGNFVWLRAVGSVSSGEITEIRYIY